MALLFNGSNNLVNCGSVAGLDDVFSAGGTITAWIYPTGWGGGSFGKIANKTELTGTFNQGWTTFISNNDGAYGNAASFSHIHTGAGNSYTCWAAPDNTVQLNVWQHIAVTFNSSDKANEALLYYNGASITPEKKSTLAGNYDSDAANDLILCGRLADRTFDGSEEDIRLYNTILSAEKIKEIYYMRGADNITGNLLARWPFIGQAVGSAATGSNSVIDISGNGYHGTPSNSPLYSEGVIHLRNKRF